MEQKSAGGAWEGRHRLVSGLSLMGKGGGPRLLPSMYFLPWDSLKIPTLIPTPTSLKLPLNPPEVALTPPVAGPSPSQKDDAVLLSVEDRPASVKDHTILQGQFSYTSAHHYSTSGGHPFKITYLFTVFHTMLSQPLFCFNLY